MKIDVYVLCKNEIKLAPFMVDYWKALAEHVEVYVYDAFSTDGTREFLSNFDFIHIIDNPEPDGLNDFNHISIKQNAWKKSTGKADFVMVCDFDETIFSYDVNTLHGELEKMKYEGYTIIRPLSFNVVSDEYPIYTKGKFLHEVAEYGYNEYKWYTKPILFDPNKISNINYVLGAHAATASGDVKWYTSDNMFLIHCKLLGKVNFISNIRSRKMSNWNLSNRLFGQTENTDSQLSDYFNEGYSKRFKFVDIKENLDKYYAVKSDWSAWSLGVVK